MRYLKQLKNWAKNTKLGQWWINTPLIEQRQENHIPEPIRWRASKKTILWSEPNPDNPKAPKFEKSSLVSDDVIGVYDTYSEAQANLPEYKGFGYTYSEDKKIRYFSEIVPAVQSV